MNALDAFAGVHLHTRWYLIYFVFAHVCVIVLVFGLTVRSSIWHRRVSISRTLAVGRSMRTAWNWWTARRQSGRKSTWRFRCRLREMGRRTCSTIISRVTKNMLLKSYWDLMLKCSKICKNMPLNRKICQHIRIKNNLKHMWVRCKNICGCPIKKYESYRINSGSTVSFSI